MSSLPIYQVNSSDSDSFTWVTESVFSISIRGYHPEESVIVNGCIKNLWTPAYFLKKITTEALKINKQGLSVFSTKSDKTPVIKITDRIVALRTKPQTEKELEIDFSHANVAGIAINCGPVVGQNKDLECLDIDCPKIAKAFLPDLKALNPDLNSILTKCVEETPSEGLHIFYYTPLGSSKCRDLASMSEEAAKAWLAESKAKGSIKKVAPPLIETRGAGGYVVGFYSQAVSKIDGLVKPYKMLHGDVATIPTLTAEEHDFLMSFAKSHDEKVTEKTLYEFDNSNQSDEKKAAIHQWRAETPWSEVLPDTYRVVEVRHDYFLIWHPDSSGREPNAIAGCKNGGMDRYWNFSPLDWRLSPNIPLTKDWVYTQSRGLIKGDPEWKKFYSKIFTKYIPKDSVDETRWEDIVEVKKSDEKNTEAMEIFSFLRPIDSENLIWKIQQDMIDTCEDFETPIICAVAGLSLAANIFSSFVGVSSGVSVLTGESYVSLLHNIILAETSAGKDHPIKYSTYFLDSLEEEYASRTLSNGKQAGGQEIDILTGEKVHPKTDEDKDLRKLLNDTLLLRFKDRVTSLGGSGVGLQDRLLIDKYLFIIVDEFADYLDGRKPGGEANNELAVLKKLYNAPPKMPVRMLKRQGKDVEAAKNIKNPITNFLAFAQPDRFKEAVLPADFSGGFMGRTGVFIEGRKTFLHEDGRKNFPARSCGKPDPDLIKEVCDRIIELEKNEMFLMISKEYENYLEQLKGQRWCKIFGKENNGVYRGSVDGRGLQIPKRISWVHSLCKQDGFLEATPDDLDYGLGVTSASYKTQDWLYNAVVGLPYQKEINAFMGTLNRLQKNTKDLTRSNVLRNWSCAKVRNADWVKSTLEPELEKLGRIRVTDKTSGTYVVLE